MATVATRPASSPTTANPVISRFLSVADLLHHLGDVPAGRVRLEPVPGTATEHDVVTVHDRENRLCELVDGVLVEKVMGFDESRLRRVPGGIVSSNYLKASMIWARLSALTA